MTKSDHLSATMLLDNAILTSWMRMDKPDFSANFFDGLNYDLKKRLFRSSTGMGGTNLEEKVKQFFKSIENSHSRLVDDMWHREFMKYFDQLSQDTQSTAEYVGGMETIPYLIEKSTMSTSLLFMKASWVVFTPIAVPLGWRAAAFQETITNEFASYAFSKGVNLQEELASLQSTSEELAAELLAANPTIHRFCMSPYHSAIDLG